MLDSDELEARLGAGPDGPLDIQDVIGIAESERELPEIIDQDSDGNIRVSSSIIRKCRCFCNVTSFLLNLSVLKRNPAATRVVLLIPGTVWLYHLCLSIALVKAELILIPSFNSRFTALVIASSDAFCS